MGVTVLKATQYDKVIMENLLQFYTYDFTELTNTAISGKGTYPLMPDFSSYFDDSDRNHPYIVRVDNEIAGFILTKELETETRKYNYLAHSFILRKFRRSGIGRQAAKIIISSYRGEWELYQLENNIPAQKFWDNVIDDISNGQVTERLENGRRYQSFVCCINQK